MGVSFKLDLSGKRVRGRDNDMRVFFLDYVFLFNETSKVLKNFFLNSI